MQTTQLAIMLLSVLSIAFLVVLPFLDARLYRDTGSLTTHSFLKLYHNEPFNDFSTVFSGLQDGTVSVLDSKVTITVYAVEILESVILRLQAKTGHEIAYDTRMLLPKAKAIDYRGATVREILDGQLKGTPFKYRFMNRILVIVKEETGKFADDGKIHFFQKTSQNDKSRTRR